MSYAEHLGTIREINDKFRYYGTLEGLCRLDQWTALPKEGGAYRRNVTAHLAELKSALFAGAGARAAAEFFGDAGADGIEDYVERGLVREFLFRFRNAVRTPASLAREAALMKIDVMRAWEEARAKDDFRVFLPWLERVFDVKRRIALAIAPDVPPFEALVGLTDEGADCAEIDREFARLARGLTELISRIGAGNVKPDTSAVDAELPPERLDAFARRLARESGYGESFGAFSHIVHGLTTRLGPRDSRVSTPLSGNLKIISTYLHEAGHAIYSAGGNGRVNAANMWGGIVGGFHEGMARFNENMIGMSRAYWEHYYPQLCEEFPRFRGVPFDVFYAALNAVRPSPRRITADEVTYSLHVIMRYELERDCISGALAVSDVEERWNNLSEEYLGLRPRSAVEGVLQDMHWAGDYVGYFQSYALGNIYGGQIYERLKCDVPQLDDCLRAGDFATPNAWLDENIRQYGCCFTAGEMAQRLTGKRLDAAPFLRYLERKYGELYGLDAPR